MAERADFLIVGGGLAGVSAAQTVRGLTSRGTITIVSGETDPPYDRPPLSKEYLRNEWTRERVLLQPAAFYQQNQIRLLLGRPALALNPASRELTLADGETIRFRRLLLSTGGRPRKLGVPGEQLAGIFELRTLAESRQIREAAAEVEHVFVIGAGFIGMEVAASLATQGIPVTVLNMDERMWPGIMLVEVASLIQRRFEARGVRFHHGTRVTGFDGKDHLELIQTDAGEFETRMAIVGAGIQLNTELAAAAGLTVNHGIVADEYLQTSVPEIFAAGDVASFPDPLGGRRHVEHWDNAIAQGRVAGANMAGKHVAFQHVPYFWSDLFDITINVIGFLDGAEETIVRGDLESGRFSVLALRGGALRGALMLNRARDRRALTELIARQTQLGGWCDRLADPGFDPATISG